MTLSNYFSDDNIIEQLCKQRIKQASKRHDQSYVERLAGISIRQPRPREIDDLLPPRSRWNAFRPRFRNRCSDPNLRALIHATQTLRATEPTQPWVVCLNRFILELREKALNFPEPSFEAPTMFWDLKKDHVYRPLSQFGLMDGVIWSLLGRYLTDFFDSAFSSRSFAFRSRQNQPMPTRETAINELFHLRQSTKSDLYVAECDIQGFFDCVEHGVALRAFDATVEAMRTTLPDRVLHSRARLLFQAYLNCYTFPGVVWGTALQRLREEDPEGCFRWPEGALRKLWKQDPTEMKIGVPQGGAVSGVIANLVLNLADRQVEAEDQGDLHYFRYCDDTLFVSADRQGCDRALSRYLTVLRQLKLPFHPPQTTWFYDKTFWKQKSKAPYCWSGRKWFGCVPWVQFIGYQMRYDGLMRVRKESVEKQRKRIREIVDEAKFGLLLLPRRGIPAKRRFNAVVLAVYHRLACAGVGKVRKGQAAVPMPKCWTGGFRGLHGKPIATRCLQMLDREREHQARRFKRAQVQQGSRNQASGRQKNRPTDFSAGYFAQFANDAGDELIKNPHQPGWLERTAFAPIYRLAQRLLNLCRVGCWLG